MFRYAALPLALLLAIGGALMMPGVSVWFVIGPIVGVPVFVLGVFDLLQTRHSVLRNYPVIGHFRWLAEAIRPELQQYFVERDTDGKPFSRDERAIIYERAKDIHGEKAFGTELDVDLTGYEWFTHSVASRPAAEQLFRVTVGGPQCERPYEMSLLNVSAMSFGSLSGNAIRALNSGAKKGGFAHDTGEGGLTRYHLEPGGDLIWEIGSGYFGCRTNDGRFDIEQFREKAVHDHVKCISIKLSQGAKPGLGGLMPAEKVTAEIAQIRGVPVGEKCVSPSAHSAFATPHELLDWLRQLRDASGGKPSGFKLCIGKRSEFLGICKAMLASGILPDFIVVDGTEGGTGAAPLEFENHVGTPLTEGLIFVQNALVGCGLRDRIRIGCSGKISSAFEMARRIAIGADYCNAARAMMMALGCIQAMRCHTNRCPVGVATQDPKRTRALVVPIKAERVYQFHRNTVLAFNDFIAAIGLFHPGELSPAHLMRRVDATRVASYAELYPPLEAGALLESNTPENWKPDWERASPDAFT